MARCHFDEQVRSEFVQDFERVEPTHRMRNTSREILADSVSVVEGATATIAHVGHGGWPQWECAHCLLQEIRDRLEQRAMRRNGDRKSLGTASAVFKRLRDDGSERSIASSDDDLSGRIDIGNVDGRPCSPDLLDEVSDTDFV